MKTPNEIGKSELKQTAANQVDPVAPGPDRQIYILGPQPEYGSLGTALDELEIAERVAIVTTGWQEDELNDQQLRDCLPTNSVNLELFRRSESLFETDSQLIRLLRMRQDELRALRDAYRVRLDHALQAIRELAKLQNQDGFDLSPEMESCFADLRRIDRQLLIRTSQVCDDYDSQLDLENRPDVVRHRNELKSILDSSEALLISGGHVAIILNRLRIFGILDMTTVPLVAWSGGAMALADQIVLFHDHPPQGRGNPEVLRAGMGVFHEILPLPNATKRLELTDSNRVHMFAHRFSSHACVALDENSIFCRSDGHWHHRDCTRLKPDGQLQELNS